MVVRLPTEPFLFSVQYPGWELNPHSLGFKSSRFAKFAYLGEGQHRGPELNRTSPGSEPGVAATQLPRNQLSLIGYTQLREVRGEGLEPSFSDSKSVGLPLADPRECPAGVEPA
jgi:hypothetical protein